jgi:hypothetical protein
MVSLSGVSRSTVSTHQTVLSIGQSGPVRGAAADRSPWLLVTHEDEFNVMLVNAHASRTYPGAKAMSAMPRGWPIWVPTAWYGPRWCRPRRFANYGI